MWSYTFQFPTQTFFAHIFPIDLKFYFIKWDILCWQFLLWWFCIHSFRVFRGWFISTLWSRFLIWKEYNIRSIISTLSSWHIFHLSTQLFISIYLGCYFTFKRCFIGMAFHVSLFCEIPSLAVSWKYILIPGE